MENRTDAAGGSVANTLWDIGGRGLEPFGIRNRHPVILRFPRKERAFRHAVRAAEIGALPAGSMLPQDPNILLFCPLAFFILRPVHTPDSSHFWRKNPVAGQDLQEANRNGLLKSHGYQVNVSVE